MPAVRVRRRKSENDFKHLFAHALVQVVARVTDTLNSVPGRVLFLGSFMGWGVRHLYAGARDVSFA
jgi:hypothetical protein